MLKTTPYRFLLLFACLLLIVTSVQAQDDEEESEIPQNQAYLGVYTDANGAANVTFIIPAEVQDREQLKRIVAGSVSFPVEFDKSPATGRYSSDEAVDQSVAELKSGRRWTTISGKGPKAFTGGILSSTCQIDLRSLLPLLRQYNLDYLKVLVLFQNGTRDVKIHGANRIPNVAGVNLYHYDLFIEVHSIPPVINFSMGYSAGDLLRKSSPLLLFLLLPALATLLSARRSSANPEELWGKHLRFVHRLLNVVWLVWLPVYFVSSLGEIIMFAFGGDLLSMGSVGQVVNVAFYFIPPVIAMFLCHVASGRVYEQVRPVDWSPRQVVRHAVIANAISLIPMFLVIVGLSMFVRSPRQAALFVIIGYVGFILLSQNIGKLLGTRLHALTSGDLRDRIFDLAQRAGVKLQQVYVLPETSAQLSNAFARSDNSVMITNSLIKNLSRREVDAIMAHEIGHLQARHPQTAGTFMTIAIVVANVVATFVYKVTYLTNAIPIVLAGAIGIAYLVTFFRSRRNERQADAIGISLTGDPEAFISGLAKLSRLNLMPMHGGGGWGESLDTHPGAMSRFHEIAKAHGISDSRLQELVTNTEPAPDKYLHVDDEVDTTVFSTEFKNKYRVRWALVALFVFLLSPVPFAWALAREGVSFIGMLTLAVEGIVWSFLISLVLRNRIVYWGYQSVCRRLKMKLDKRGLGEAARNGSLVGLSPAAESRKYEGYSFWDMGVLWLTKDKLYYIGEKCEFALEREQMNEVFSCDTAPDWVTEKSLFIRWKDSPEGPTKTLHFVPTGEVAVTKARRAIDELQTRVEAWMQQREDFPAASPPLDTIGLPVFPEITSTPALMKFNPAFVFKAAFNLAFYAAVLAFAIRLSYTSIVYMALALFTLTLIDELSKIIKGKRVAQIIPAPASFTNGTYQRGSWRNA